MGTIFIIAAGIAFIIIAMSIRKDECLKDNNYYFVHYKEEKEGRYQIFYDKIEEKIKVNFYKRIIKEGYNRPVFSTEPIQSSFTQDETDITLNSNSKDETALKIASGHIRRVSIEEKIKADEKLGQDVKKLMESDIWKDLDRLKNCKIDFTYSIDLKNLYFECSYMLKVNEDFINFNIEACPYLIIDGYVMVEHKVKGADEIIKAIGEIKIKINKL